MVDSNLIKNAFELYDAFRKAELDVLFDKYRDKILKDGIVFCGVGKNWYLAEELTKLFISFGIKAQSLDCTHALHGDCGLLKDQVIFFMSRSGTTSEMITLAKYLKQSEAFNNELVLITFDIAESEYFDYVVSPVNATDIKLHEFDQRNLVPSLSLCVVLAMLSEFGVMIFESDSNLVARYKDNHPGGKIGETLKCNQ